MIKQSDYTKSQIIKNTVQLIAEQGVAASTSKKIAQASKVSEALVFKYFGSLDVLYHTVIEEALDHFGAIALDPRIQTSEAFVSAYLLQLIQQIDEQASGFIMLQKAEREGYLSKEKGLKHHLLKSGALLEARYLLKESSLSTELADFTLNAMLTVLFDALFAHYSSVDTAGKEKPDATQWAVRLTTLILHGIRGLNEGK